MSTHVGQNFPARLVTSLATTICVSLLMLTACDSDQAAGPESEQAAVQTSQPVSSNDDQPEPEPDVRIRIDATDPLRFDPLRFTVKPGQLVEIELVNIDDMRHNLLIVKPGTRAQVVADAMAMGAEADAAQYAPDSEDVLAATPVLTAGQSYTLRFRVPEQTGIYPYVCTYPGHGQIMFGAMYVDTDDEPDLPELWDDPNLPEQHRPQPPRDGQPIDARTPSGSEDWHPYETTYPALYRTVLPGKISAASIAVGLPGGESFAWDAGFSRLRYVWAGDFIDPRPHWRGRGNDRAQIRGDIWYEETSDFPLRFGEPDHIPDHAHIQFLGYNLDDDGYPEFQYKVDDYEIRERITERPNNQPGIQRTFRIPNASQPVWFAHPPDTDASFHASAGQWDPDRPHMLRLSPQEAELFILTITPAEDDQ